MWAQWSWIMIHAYNNYHFLHPEISNCWLCLFIRRRTYISELFLRWFIILGTRVGFEIGGLLAHLCYRVNVTEAHAAPVQLIVFRACLFNIKAEKRSENEFRETVKSRKTLFNVELPKCFNYSQGSKATSCRNGNKKKASEWKIEQWKGDKGWTCQPSKAMKYFSLSWL